MFSRLGLFILSVFVFAATSLAQPTTAPVVKVAGSNHVLVLFADGTVVGWGRGHEGQLGPVKGVPMNGLYQVQSMVPISLPGKAVDIAAGSNLSFAVMDDGRVYAWGSNVSDGFGVGSAAASLKLPDGSPGSERPVLVPGVRSPVQLVARGSTAMALMPDGTIMAWGSNTGGVMGDGTHPRSWGLSPKTQPTPKTIPGVSGVTKISLCGGHVMALTRDGHVLTWGSNHAGALGREPWDEIPLDTAAEVPGLSGVVDISAASWTSTVVKQDGSVWVWGANAMAEFGNGQRTNPPGMTSGWELKPQRVPGVANAVAVYEAGGSGTIVLLKDGTLRAWGNSDLGKLGAGLLSGYHLQPVVPKITGVKKIFTAGMNSFAVKNDGSLWIWGRGERDGWPLHRNIGIPMPMPWPKAP